jgi:hypothetical protein
MTDETRAQTVDYEWLFENTIGCTTESFSDTSTPEVAPLQLNDVSGGEKLTIGAWGNESTFDTEANTLGADGLGAAVAGELAIDAEADGLGAAVAGELAIDAEADGLGAAVAGELAIDAEADGLGAAAVVGGLAVNGTESSGMISKGMLCLVVCLMQILKNTMVCSESVNQRWFSGVKHLKTLASEGHTNLGDNATVLRDALLMHAVDAPCGFSSLWSDMPQSFSDAIIDLNGGAEYENHAKMIGNRERGHRRREDIKRQLKATGIDIEFTFPLSPKRAKCKVQVKSQNVIR